MIRDFKPSLLENTPSKTLYHTEVSQQTRLRNQKATEILEIQKLVEKQPVNELIWHKIACNCIANEFNQHTHKTSAFTKQITPQIASHGPTPIDVISCLIRQYNINLTHYIKIQLSVSCES